MLFKRKKKYSDAAMKAIRNEFLTATYVTSSKKMVASQKPTRATQNSQTTNVMDVVGKTKDMMDNDSFQSAASHFIEVSRTRRLLVEDSFGVSVGTTVHILIPEQTRLIKAGNYYNNLYKALQSMRDCDKVTLKFCGQIYYHVRATVTANPDGDKTQNTLLYNKDIISMYNQGCSLVLSFPGVNSPMEVKWSYMIQQYDEEKVIPVQLWAALGYYHDYYSLLQ
jgi:hypothetical protein